MRKILPSIAVVLALFVASCGGKVAEFLTVGVDNPLGIHELAIITSGYKTALNPTLYYLDRRTCRRSEDEATSWVTLTPFNPCHQYARAVVVRGALERAQKYRRQLSQFVRQNRTVDARIAYEEFKKAVAIMETVPKKPEGM